MRSIRADQRGAVLPLVAVTLSGILGVAALVIDAGYGFALRREHQAIADAAARAGAMRLDEDLLRSSGRVRLDAPAAARAARAYLRARGFRGTAAISATPRSVRVSLSSRHRPVLAGMFGVRTVTVGARSVARPRAGITAPEGS